MTYELTWMIYGRLIYGTFGRHMNPKTYTQRNEDIIQMVMGMSAPVYMISDMTRLKSYVLTSANMNPQFAFLRQPKLKLVVLVGGSDVVYALMRMYRSHFTTPYVFQETRVEAIEYLFQFDPTLKNPSAKWIDFHAKGEN